MDEGWRNEFGILMCMEICDGAGAGICDGAPSTFSSVTFVMLICQYLHIHKIPQNRFYFLSFQVGHILYILHLDKIALI